MKSSYHALYIGANKFSLFFIFVLLTGCTLNNAPTQNLTWVDVNWLMDGVCFESAFDAAEQVFSIRNEDDLSTFYDLVDNSDLCRRPIERQNFDFSDGKIVAGLWSFGNGCTARHDVLDVIQENSAVTFQIRFTTEGDCPYELIRPFWVAATADDIYIQIIE